MGDLNLDAAEVFVRAVLLVAIGLALAIGYGTAKYLWLQ